LTHQFCTFPLTIPILTIINP